VCSIERELQTLTESCLHDHNKYLFSHGAENSFTKCRKCWLVKIHQSPVILEGQPISDFPKWCHWLEGHSIVITHHRRNSNLICSFPQIFFSDKLEWKAHKHQVTGRIELRLWTVSYLKVGLDHIIKYLQRFCVAFLDSYLNTRVITFQVDLGPVLNRGGGSTRGRYSMEGGSTRGQYSIEGGSTRGRYSIEGGSTRGQYSIEGGSTRGQYSIEGGSTRGRYSIEGGSTMGR
jgi:hypothetical protein